MLLVLYRRLKGELRQRRKQLLVREPLGVKVLLGRASQLGGRQALLMEGVMMSMVFVQRSLDKEAPRTK